MIAALWLRGLLRRQAGRMLGTAAGIAISVGLLVSIGSFLSSAKGAMTRQAVGGVVVDWQVAVQPGADPGAVLEATRRHTGVVDAVPVGFGTTTGLHSSVGGSTQSTGSGFVLGLPPGYASTFRGSIRSLTGSSDGVLLAQQTAANLHAAPGDEVVIGLAGAPDAHVRVDGVVDLPNIDSLFQKVGAPAGAQPQAPPDNVVLLPAAGWRAIYDPLAQAGRTDVVANQVHARLARHLPHDPAAAFGVVSGSAHRLEAATSGAAVVGNNLGATLDAARSDAQYAQLLFLLLGLPGAVIAALLTRLAAASGEVRRRRQMALLRARGATLSTMSRLALLEALATGVGGGLLGLALGAAVGARAFGSATFGSNGASGLAWSAAALATGLVIAVAAVLVPARRDAKNTTVSGSRASLSRPQSLGVLRWLLDLWLILGAAIVYSIVRRQGYSLVLAPEGVPTVSVSYWALAGPLLLWVGGGLLIWRLGDLVLRSRSLMGRLLGPLSPRLGRVLASSVSRQRRPISNAAALFALAVAFAVSTAVFNATYRQQVAADARLTNGADVTVTQAGTQPMPPSLATRVQATPGVRTVEPIRHRYAYVGADLQDLFGVRASTVVSAARLESSWFQGGTAKQLMDSLRAHPDGLLVAAETVKDFQLQRGDLLRLRLRDTRTGDLTMVPFHYIGVAKEFPTAPKDSFMVANSDYVAARTGDSSISTLLIDTGGSGSGRVAGRLRPLVGNGATISDLATSRRVVGSSLTAVDLSGLTKVELAFALLLAAAAAGLVLGLGLVERRRSLVLVAALGGKRRQVAAFLRSEVLVTGFVGLVGGSAVAFFLAEMLVKVLTGVFDPPPARLATPWGYLVGVAAVALAAAAIASQVVLRHVRRAPVEALRDL